MTTSSELGRITIKPVQFGHKDYAETIHVVQGDTERNLRFRIKDENGAIISALPTGMIVRLFVAASDGSAGFVNGSFTDGFAEIELKAELLLRPGLAIGQIQLVNPETKEKISTFHLSINIHNSLEMGATVASDFWFDFSELKAGVAEVNALADAYEQALYEQGIIAQEVQTNADDMRAKYPIIVDYYNQMKTVIDSEAARVNAENTRASQETARVTAESARASEEDTRKSQETARVNAEDTREMQESSRQSAETERKEQFTKSQDLYTKGNTLYNNANPLYADLLAIKEILGTDPAVELAQSVAELQDADLDFLEAWRASSHLIDPAKDLITEAGTLYRLTHVIEDGIPWLRHVEVGKSILNGGMELTAPGNAPRMRLYWKAQGERSEADAYIAAWAGEEQANRYVGEIDNYTRQYSAVFDLSATRTVTLSTLTAWGQEVKIWDFDWRVEV